MTKPPSVKSRLRFDIPVREASALAVRWTGRTARLICAGDSDAVVAAADITVEGLSDWRTLDLTELDGWGRSGLLHGPSQFEALAVDGGHIVALLREDPPLLLLTDTRNRALTHIVGLSVPADSPLHGQWDDPGSRGEGLMLLRDGHILVAKEKHPAALVEMGPPGAAPNGLCPESFLGPGETFQLPADERPFEALAVWYLAGEAEAALVDVSDLDRDGEGRLWLISDQSQKLACLALDDPLSPAGGKVERLDGLWRLPKNTKKPEGLAVLEHHVVVAMDTKKPKDNGMALPRPSEIGD